jgi:hypothetical protein
VVLVESRRVDPRHNVDFQLALAMAYELHHRGFDDVSDDLEWAPDLIAARRMLEDAFELDLRDAARTPARAAEDLVDLPTALIAVVASDTTRSVARDVGRSGTAEHYRDLVRRRSVYHLKEADPHTWTIPRLSGRSKAALVEIQADEYGGGRPQLMHSALFADLMVALDLDPTYGAYWAEADASSFATVNAMMMFGLNRRLRAASIGHLAVLEMTSTEPNRHYGDGLRRLGYDEPATRFYDAHVGADALHEQIAMVDLCGSYVAENPDERATVLFGAAACVALEQEFAASLRSTWEDSARLVA